MKILVLNCGSSSIKYQVIDMKSATEYSLLVKGIIERIGLSDAILTHKPVGKPVYEVVRSMRIVPIKRDDVLRLVGATLVPIVPLELTMMSLEELLKKLLGVLF